MEQLANSERVPRNAPSPNEVSIAVPEVAQITEELLGFWHIVHPLLKPV